MPLPLETTAKAAKEKVQARERRCRRAAAGFSSLLAGPLCAKLCSLPGRSDPNARSASGHAGARRRSRGFDGSGETCADHHGVFLRPDWCVRASVVELKLRKVLNPISQSEIAHSLRDRAPGPLRCCTLDSSPHGRRVWTSTLRQEPFAEAVTPLLRQHLLSEEVSALRRCSDGFRDRHFTDSAESWLSAKFAATFIALCAILI